MPNLGMGRNLSDLIRPITYLELTSSTSSTGWHLPADRCRRCKTPPLESAPGGAVPGDGAEGLWEENGRKNEEN